MEPARIRIDYCRSGGIMRTVGYLGVDLAFTGVLAKRIRGNLGLLRPCRWRVPVWIGTISEGFYLLHIPGLSITDRWLAPWPGIPPHGSAEVFLPLATAISWAWSRGVVRVAILRLNDRFLVQDAAGEALVTRASAN